MNDQISEVTAEELMNMISQWAYNSYLYGEYIGKGIINNKDNFNQKEQLKQERRVIEIIVNSLVPAN